MDVTLVAPDGSTPVVFGGGIQLIGRTEGAATNLTAGMTGNPGKRIFLSGIYVTGLGATAATSIDILLQYYATSGASSTTFMLFRNIVVVPAGVTTAIAPVTLSFPVPLAYPIATGPGYIQGWQGSINSFGAGNTLASIALMGFEQ